MDDVAALVVRIGIGRGMHRVVMILRVGRIDGDERQLAPVLAAFQRRRLRVPRPRAPRRRRECLRNFVGVDRDQADRLFARQRAQPLLHLAGGEAIAARAHEIDADEVAVLGAAGIRWRDVQFAAGLLLVDGNEPAAAAGGFAEDAEQARCGRDRSP